MLKAQSQHAWNTSARQKQVHHVSNIQQISQFSTDVWCQWPTQTASLMAISILNSLLEVYRPPWYRLASIMAKDNMKAELMLKILVQAVCNSYGWATTRSSSIAKRTVLPWLNIIKNINFLKWVEPRTWLWQVQHSTVVLAAKTAMIGVHVQYYNNDGHFAIEASGKF